MAIVYEIKGDAPVSRITPYTMESGGTFRGTLSDDDVDVGSNSGAEGDLIRIDLSAGWNYSISLTGIGSNPVDDPTLILLDSDLAYLGHSYDIDSPDNLDSLIEYTPETSGTYYILATGNDTGDYEIEVSLDLPFYDYRKSPGIDTYDEIVHQLTDDYWESSDTLPRSFFVGPGGTLNVDITALTAEGQQLARWALEAWTNVTGIDFRFVDSANPRIHITFDDNEDGAFSYSTVDFTGRFIISSHVNVSTDWLADLGTTIDSYSFQTYLHEIGHALGLGHPGDYNNTATYGVDNEFLNDSWQATVMSYFDQYGNTDIDADLAYVMTPMIADIIAIQHLYGAPTDINSGNTVYGSNSNVGGYLGEIFALITGEQWDPDLFNGGRSLTLTIYDTGGIDTLDLSTAANDQRVDLNPGGISDVLGLTGNLSIAFGTVIENFVGGAGNDTVIGNAVANHMEGRDGNDQFWGGGGNDTLLGGEGNDSLNGEEGNDRLIGGEDKDSLWGNAGNDSLWGNAGHDNLVGGSGDDTLYGGHDSDWLRGHSGNDRLNGGAGDDRLEGGEGLDTLDYSWSVDEGVTVNLATGMGSGGHAEGDIVSGFENIAGSTHDDRLIGDGSNNELTGGGGHDTLVGGAGNDKLIGNTGRDTLWGGRGADTLWGGGGDDILWGGEGNDRVEGGDHNDRLNGGAGADRLIGGAGWDTLDYGGSGAGVTVNLATGMGSGGHAEGDTVSGFENIAGSTHDDRLIGDGSNNELTGSGGHDTLAGNAGNDKLIGSAGHDTLFGGRGTDTLWGGGGNDRLYGGDGKDWLAGGDDNDRLNGGAGADRLNGGAGWDTLDYGGSGAGVTVNLATRTVSGGHAEGDRVSGFENVTGSAHSDRITGDGGNNQLSGSGGHDTLYGDAGNDRLLGNTGNDALWGGRGSDTLWGGGGNDRLYGGHGGDTLEGGEGNDRINGGAGADLLIGGRGRDTLDYSWSVAAGVAVNLATGSASGGHAEGDTISGFEDVIGSENDDRITGHGGANELTGGGGSDVLIGSAGNDTLIGNAGDDTLWGGRDADTLWGGRGHDALAGGAGNDTLAGGEGNDWINGGAGTDRLIGGAGRDTLDYTGSGAGVTVSLATGMVSGGHAEGDTVSGFEDVAGSAFDDHITGDGGANELAGGRGHDRLTGGAGNDKLIGGMGHDTLFGGRGTDTLRGGGGDDTLYGGDDDDRLIGGDHNDRLIGGAGADTLAGGAGWDTLEYVGSDAGVTVNLATGEVSGGDAEGDTISGFEKVTGSAHGDRITGDGGNNELAGGGGHDALYGDTGTDRLIGNAGHDTLFGGAGNDTLWGGRGDDTLYGGHDDDTLEGGEGDDRLNGGAGADTLVGGSGRDTLDYSWSVDEGVTVNLATGAASGGHAEGDTVSGFEDVIGSQYADVISGDGGANELTGGGGDDRLTGNAGNDRLMGDADNDTLIGNTGNDTLWGGRGNDTLWGGNDDDRLIGGAGADRLTGGAGDDRFVFGRGHGSDTIVQFADGEDLIDLTGFSLSGFSDLTIAGSAQGVTIDLSGHGGGSILLEGFGLANLDESDFLF